jgi:hypothetical protein
MEGAREHGAADDLWIERKKSAEAGHKVSYLLKYISLQILLICSNRGRLDDLNTWCLGER